MPIGLWSWSKTDFGSVWLYVPLRPTKIQARFSGFLVHPNSRAAASSRSGEHCWWSYFMCVKETFFLVQRPGLQVESTVVTFFLLAVVGPYTQGSCPNTPKTWGSPSSWTAVWPMWSLASVYYINDGAFQEECFQTVQANSGPVWTQIESWICFNSYELFGSFLNTCHVTVFGCYDCVV